MKLVRVKSVQAVEGVAVVTGVVVAVATLVASSEISIKRQQARLAAALSAIDKLRAVVEWADGPLYPHF